MAVAGRKGRECRASNIETQNTLGRQDDASALLLDVCAPVTWCWKQPGDCAADDPASRSATCRLRGLNAGAQQRLPREAVTAVKRKLYISNAASTMWLSLYPIYLPTSCFSCSWRHGRFEAFSTIPFPPAPDSANLSPLPHTPVSHSALCYQ